MSPVAFASRLVGLAVAVAGGVLAWGGFLAPTGGVRGVDLLARGAVLNPPVLVGAVGVGFVAAGLAVLLDRGRAVAVSVGGLALAGVVVLLVVGADATPSVVGVGVVALASTLAGAAIDDPAA